MKRLQLTIARLMLAILVIGINAALIRAFFEWMFTGVILLFFAMQLGFFLLSRSQGQARRFWVGFELAAIAVVLAMCWCGLFVDSALNGCVDAYTVFALDTVVESPPISARVADSLLSLPPDSPLLDAAVLFAPEFVLALLGGLLAMMIGYGPRRHGLRPNPLSTRCPQPSGVLTSNGCDREGQSFVTLTDERTEDLTTRAQ